MIQWIYESAQRATTIEEVMVATDDERIFTVVNGFGGHAVMTSPTHPSGTDRLAEVARNVECEMVVNVQGDEPLIRPEQIDQLVTGLRDDPRADMATLMTKIRDREELISPHVVKVVTDQEGFALYFSRSPLPFLRKGWKDLTSITRDHGMDEGFFKHIGIYGYRRPFLLTLSSLHPTPLEEKEELEQLRALEHGYRIKVMVTEYESQHVDTQGDLNRVEEMLRDES
jgi:3-deoxy-manno-octulosonate cytidylyltransferase (CMP-KDO synthetase)